MLDVGALGLGLKMPDKPEQVLSTAMGLDVEVGRSREDEDGEESDDQTDDESTSTPPSMDRGGQSPCLCQQFEHQTFLRRLEQEAHVECQWMTFFKELVYHLIFPLSLPLLYWFEGGVNGIVNRQFWGSRVAIRQWIFAIAFYSMNVISRFFVVPDIVIANMLIIMTYLILATKYGFYTKSDMKEMREKVLPQEALDDRTLFLAWTNPIPLRILKRQLLLAASRNNMLKCSQTLRVVPGASRNTVKEIMHQLSHEKGSSTFMRTGRVRVCKSRKPSKVEAVNCAYCVKNSCTDREMEDRWVQLIMSRLHHDPKCQLPESAEMSSEEDSRFESSKAAGDVDNDDAPFKKDKTTNDLVDLPAILLAAHLLQQSGYLLSKKKLGHQLLKNPMRVVFASGVVGFIHTAIPYIIRGITGKPYIWGGNAWYVHVANLCSIVINSQCMSASVTFMIAGVADFRRRYFAARLLNTLLKDGCIGTESVCPVKIESVETDACFREVRKQEERRKSEYHTGVAVDYGRASSIVGWWAMRVLVLDFGLVFSKRVKCFGGSQYYASYFCIYCGVLMAFLLIVLFAKGTDNAAFTMGVVAFDLLVFIGLLSLIVFPGGETNKMHLGHGATLVFKKMELSNKLRGPLGGVSPAEREPFLFALKVMGTVSEALAWDNTITKVTILGFKAGSEVISVLLGFGGAAIGIVAQQFTSYVGGNSQ